MSRWSEEALRPLKVLCSGLRSLTSRAEINHPALVQICIREESALETRLPDSRFSVQFCFFPLHPPDSVHHLLRVQWKMRLSEEAVCE